MKHLKQTPEYLVLIERLPREKGGQYLCRYRCSCGNEFTACVYKVLSGHTKSCGCKKGLQRHGGNRTKLYQTWRDMRARCGNTRHRLFQYYGGKGVSVCKEWDDFAVFRDWALAAGYKEGLTIDRVRADGDYTPKNCLWVSSKIQNMHLSPRRNKTGFSGVTKTPAGRFAARLNINKKHVNIGTFDSPEEAHLAYMKAIKERNKDYCKEEGIDYKKYGL